MNYVVYTVVGCVILFIDVVSISMLLRIIVSLFSMGNPSKVANFLYVITEPLILPVRAICDRFGWFRQIPLDIPFLITSVMLSFVSVFLQGLL